MKQLILFLPMLLFGCATTPKVPESQSGKLFEVISQQSQGGASIQFYEILSEESEIAMLKNDETLKNKISSDDLKKSTFVILNMGEKPTSGFSISVADVIEHPEKIIITVKESVPNPDTMQAQVMTYPFAVVKINSKKPIEIK